MGANTLGPSRALVLLSSSALGGARFGARLREQHVFALTGACRAGSGVAPGEDGADKAAKAHARGPWRRCPRRTGPGTGRRGPAAVYRAGAGRQAQASTLPRIAGDRRAASNTSEPSPSRSRGRRGRLAAAVSRPGGTGHAPIGTGVCAGQPLVPVCSLPPGAARPDGSALDVSYYPGWAAARPGDTNPGAW